jgi:Fe-S cluster assembly scaffold protein SufB
MQQIIIDQPNQKVELPVSGEYEVLLTKSGASVEIWGGFLTRKNESVDIHLLIRHQAPHTQANTVLKGVAYDQSKIRLLGRIIIEKHCGDSHSFLEERILLLSDQAKAEAVPELEILTDDVKCSHAASISRIPREHLFYLQSRGLPVATAQQLIVDSFLQP